MRLLRRVDGRKGAGISPQNLCREAREPQARRRGAAGPLEARDEAEKKCVIANLSSRLVLTSERPSERQKRAHVVDDDAAETYDLTAASDRELPNLPRFSGCCLLKAMAVGPTSLAAFDIEMREDLGEGSSTTHGGSADVLVIHAELIMLLARRPASSFHTGCRAWGNVKLPRSSATVWS